MTIGPPDAGPPTAGPVPPGRPAEPPPGLIADPPRGPIAGPGGADEARLSLPGDGTGPVDYSVVVPTVGRPTLGALLGALDDADGPPPREVVIVDDRRRPDRPLLLPPRQRLLADVPFRVLCSGGCGPAQARNVGWRAATATWVAFLDDDVVPTFRWPADLVADLEAADADTVGVQGRLVVPLPVTRRSTDDERGVAGLAGARWATADMAYRRGALVALNGFDPRFPRAYREDAELALRVLDAGWDLSRGRRTTLHPARRGRWWASVARQAGNADDALMRRLHGPDWAQRAGAPRGRRRDHVVTTALGVAALGAAVGGQRRPAALAAGGWAALTVRFGARRLAPGPADLAEAVSLTLTSVVIPPVATLAWLSGRARARRLIPVPPPGAGSGRRRPRRLLAPDRRTPEREKAGAEAAMGPARRGPDRSRRTGSHPTRRSPPRPRVAAVLFDRDGTLVLDVPYNTQAGLVAPMPGAIEATRRLRAAGLRLGVVSNQSGIGRGLITPEQLAEVNRRVDELLGPFDVILVCPHTEADGCPCRKPRPGLLREAARRLGVAPAECLVVGDIGADVEAARGAGMPSVLVPTEATRPGEVAGAPLVATDLTEVVDAVLAGRDWSAEAAGRGRTRRLSARPGPAAAPRAPTWWRRSR